MSVLKEEAMHMIQNLPEDQVQYVIQYIQILNTRAEKTQTPEMAAFLELEQMLIPAKSDIDYDKELAEAREEKYGNIN